jgi:hypothetical protein
MILNRNAPVLAVVASLFAAQANAQDNPQKADDAAAKSSSSKRSSSRRTGEAKKADEAKKVDEVKADEVKRPDELKKHDEVKVEEPKKADEVKKPEEPKKTDEVRRGEEPKRADEPRKRSDVKRAEALKREETKELLATDPLDTSYDDINFTLRVQLETESSPNDTTGSAPEIGAGVSYGHSFSSGVEPFVEAEYITYSDTFTGGSMSSTSINLGLGVLFNLYPHKPIEAGALRPYGGAIIVRTDQTVKSQLEGESEFTRRVTDMNTQFVFGTKYFLTHQMAFNPQMRFFTTNGDRTAGSDTMKSRRLGIDFRLIGLTLIF